MRVVTSVGSVAVLLLGLAVAAPAAAAPPAPAGTVALQDSGMAPNAVCSSYRKIAMPEGTHIRVPSVSYGGSTNCLLRRGNTGSGVRRLQIALRECNGGPYNGSIDGIFGPQTESAVRYAQNRENITVDGIYGPQTRSYMWWPSYNSSGQLTGEHCWGYPW